MLVFSPLVSAFTSYARKVHGAMVASSKEGLRRTWSTQEGSGAAEDTEEGAWLDVEREEDVGDDTALDVMEMDDVMLTDNELDGRRMEGDDFEREISGVELSTVAVDPDDDCEADDTIELLDGVALGEELSEELTDRLVEDDFEVDGDSENEATSCQLVCCHLIGIMHMCDLLITEREADELEADFDKVLDVLIMEDDEDTALQSP